MEYQRQKLCESDLTEITKAVSKEQGKRKKGIGHDLSFPIIICRSCIVYTYSGIIYLMQIHKLSKTNTSNRQA